MNTKQETLNKLLTIARTQCGCELYASGAKNILAQYNSISEGEITKALAIQAKAYGIADEWRPNPAPFCSIVSDRLRVPFQLKPTEPAITPKVTEQKTSWMHTILPFLKKSNIQGTPYVPPQIWESGVCSTYVTGARHQEAWFIIINFSVSSSNSGLLKHYPAEICMIMPTNIQKDIIKALEDNLDIVHTFVINLFNDARFGELRNKYLNFILPFTHVGIHEMGKLRPNTGTARSNEDWHYIVSAGMFPKEVPHPNVNTSNPSVVKAEKVDVKDTTTQIQSVAESVQSEDTEIEHLTKVISGCIDPIVKAHNAYLNLLISFSTQLHSLQTRISSGTPKEALDAMDTLSSLDRQLVEAKRDLAKKHALLLEQLPSSCSSLSAVITTLQAQINDNSKIESQELSSIQNVISTLKSLDDKQKIVAEQSTFITDAHEKLRSAYANRAAQPTNAAVQQVKTAVEGEEAKVIETTRSEVIIAKTAEELAKVTRRTAKLAEELKKVNLNAFKKIELSKSLEESVNSLRRYLSLTEVPSVLIDTNPKSAAQVRENIGEVKAVEISFTTKTTLKELSTMCQKQLRTLNNLIKIKGECGPSSKQFFMAMEKAQAHFKKLNDQIRTQ